ncbi:aromatic ring-hydroxylating oxygenase subunit alpha [Candidatus Poriferisodalis sp.]|uniref:aromatic ring-hydroxylating oxygenase subunit alpha n=1 Tax=Candidatus Poriferisodalis sp. TaxID=3101277 RepID=UPI003B02AADB
MGDDSLEAGSSAAPGAARGPGPTLREQILADPIRPPDPLLVESPVFLGDENLSFEPYLSTAYAEQEVRHVWGKTWQWACHVDHIREPGDYCVYDVGPYSALVVRAPSGEIKAYFNSCMHRGTQLRPAGSCGFAQQIKCPFHGWTWSLDGQLIEVPSDWDFPHVDPASHGLTEMPVGEWAGFVFVNFDRDAGPLDEYLGVLPDHFAEVCGEWGLENRYIETHLRKRLPCNWKAAAEAFIEAYHVRETHATGRPGDEVTTQYDVFEPNVSRFIHTIGMDGPERPVPRTEQQMLTHLTRNIRHGMEPLELPEGQRARDFYADFTKSQLGTQYGHDFSGLSESVTLDSIEYFLFPNAFFFPGLSLPMVYRFRPDPDDVDFSYFELLMMRPRPASGDAPPPPQVIELDVDDSYTKAAGLGGLGRVYDQDTANMAAQTRGFKASARGTQTLGNYQESRVRHLQRRVRECIASGEAAV